MLPDVVFPVNRDYH